MSDFNREIAQREKLPDATLSMLRLLAFLDAQGMKIRDVLVLWAVIRRPHLSSSGLARIIGYKHRNNIKNYLDRLTNMGLIKDLRETAGKAVPNRYVATDEGVEFWNAYIIK